MEIIKASVTKKDLSKLRSKELDFFIQGGWMLNEISILHKLTIFSNKHSDIQIVRNVQNSQSLFLLTLLAGKLCEGWKYFVKKSLHYQNHLTPTALENIEKLKAYFSTRDNLINKIRNKIAFHYDPKHIMDVFYGTPDDEVFELYLNQSVGNSFAFISSVLLLNSILQDDEGSDPIEVIDKFFMEILGVANWFIIFLQECLAVIVERQIPVKLEKSDVPAAIMEEVVAPFFVERKKVERVRQS